MPRPKNPDSPTTRSFRVAKKAWEQARIRATAEGTYMSSVCADLVEGYARGIYNLPERKIVRQYPDEDNTGNPEETSEDTNAK